MLTLSKHRIANCLLGQFVPVACDGVVRQVQQQLRQARGLLEGLAL
jgi:hypothetical protein